MNRSAKTLLQLLKIAIVKCVQVIGEGVNWQGVAVLAQKQGVRGLAYDALERVKQDNKKCVTFPDRITLMQWYAQTIFVEKKYAQHLSLSKDVVDLWKKHGIKTVVFKGIAHSRYYPKPEHREFGDFDCYLIDDVHISKATNLLERTG